MKKVNIAALGDSLTKGVVCNFDGYYFIFNGFFY